MIFLLLYINNKKEEGHIIVNIRCSNSVITSTHTVLQIQTLYYNECTPMYIVLCSRNNIK